MFEKEARFLKVAIEMKKATPKINREVSRKNFI